MLQRTEEFGQWLVFQGDCPQPHYHHSTTSFLNETNPQRWTDHGHPKSWPLDLQSLIPMDLSCGILSQIMCMSYHYHLTMKTFNIKFIKTLTQLSKKPCEKCRSSCIIQISELQMELTPNPYEVEGRKVGGGVRAEEEGEEVNGVIDTNITLYICTIYRSQ